MGKLGISIYPERSTFEKDKAYLDLAHKYGYKRVFTSLLQINDDKEKVLSEFKEVVDYANSLGMEVMVDINPALFEQLEISYDDLSFSIRWVPTGSLRYRIHRSRRSKNDAQSFWYQNRDQYEFGHELR